MGKRKRENSASAIQARLLQTTVLLNRQYLLTDHLIDTRSIALKEFEIAINTRQQTLNHILDVYNYVFALIDHLVRYQKIAFVLPGINQKSPEFKSFNQSMGKLKDIRNQLQHINNDIENDYSGPLLGTICWVSNLRQYIAFFHDIGRERSSPSLVLDTKTMTYTQQFSYVYNETYHDLDKAIEGLRSFHKFINSVVHIKKDGKLCEPEKDFLAVCVDMHSSASQK